MVQDKESKNKYDKEDMDVWLQSQKNWRAWGSWFSWGSPIGLGIFFVLVAATVWIFVPTFKQIGRGIKEQFHYELLFYYLCYNQS